MNGYTGVGSNRRRCMFCHGTAQRRSVIPAEIAAAIFVINLLG